MVGYSKLPDDADAQELSRLVAEEKYRTSTPGTATPRHDYYPPTPIPARKRRFERSPKLPLFMHLAACGVAYPVAYFGPRFAQGHDLFIARLIVALFSGAIGGAIGYTLLELARPAIEATVWATVVHESADGRPGMTVNDVSYYTYNPNSAFTGAVLLWRRWKRYDGAKSPNRPYDKVKWGAVVAIFIFALIFIGSITFALGRIIIIYTVEERQRSVYEEGAIVGDLSAQDLSNAANFESTFTDFTSAWSIAPFTSLADLPSPVSIEWSPKNGGENQTVWFSEYAQLTNGKGFGTFEIDVPAPEKESIIVPDQVRRNDRGHILRWPRWGIRIACQTLPLTAQNFVAFMPESRKSYVFVPQPFVDGLVTQLNTTLPITQITGSPFDPTDILGNDTLPSTIDLSNIRTGRQFFDQGSAYSFFSQPLNRGEAGHGWLQLEVMFVRLNMTTSPNATFPVTLNVTPDLPLGVDAVACVEELTPWLVDAYNGTLSTVGPFAVDNLGPGDTVLGQGGRRKGDAYTGNASQRLNSTDKWPAFAIAHANSRNTFLKDNNREARYVPSPSLVSMTDGAGPRGYSSLSADRVAMTIAIADANHLLPYLVGSQYMVMQAYEDRTAAFTEVLVIPLACFLGVAALLGVVAAQFVPTLPMGLPRRDFSVSSWIGSVQMDEHHPDRSRGASIPELKVLKDTVGQLRVRYQPVNQARWGHV